jgi:conjugal transfer mating pair stabilization protein TraG
VPPDGRADSVPPDGRTTSVPPDGRVERTPSANWPPNLRRFSNSGVTARLPTDDPNIHHYKPLAWGTPRTIELIRSVAAEYRARTGYQLRVGDISQRGGGDVPGHGSHEQGRNIDLDLAFNDGRTTAEPSRNSRNASWRSPAYDRDATRTMIRLIKQANPNAQILFNDPVLVREGLVRPFPGHDNHLHVQHLY